MHSILIVDDEKIVRDGVCELLSMEEGLELVILSAASAPEAQSILETRRVDIVLTDIGMPQISGLEFFDIILERWPYCKVIFLTGYSEFDYVYKVHKRARYVLKADGDDKIVAAVKETIEEIENDLYIDKVVNESSELLRMKNETESQLLLRDIVSGHVSSDELTQNLADKLDIPLAIGKDAYYVVMYHKFQSMDSYENQLVLNDRLYELVGKYFYGHMCGISVLYTRNFGLLILQGKTQLSLARGVSMLKGNSELFQRAYNKNIEGTVSLYVCSRPIAFKEIINRFHVLRSELLMHDDEVLLMDSCTSSGSDDNAINTQQQNDIFYSKAQMIDYYFENNDHDGVSAIIKEASENYKNVDSMHELNVVSIYTTIASKLIAYTNQVGLSQEMCFKIGIVNLYNLSLHDNWCDAFDYLISVADAIFELRLSNTEKQNKDVIVKIKDYILENLDKDTSLTTLADYVELSPEHLLRLFKKREGITILHYINELKIVKAKNSLSDKTRPIKDIAEELGFTSTGYFGRFFKSKTGMPPQLWRDKH